MSEMFSSLPFGLAYVGLFLGAMLRANTTYWIGRGIARGAEHSRFKHFLEGPIYERAQRFTERWGIFAVPLSFLTVGIQTAVNASAGMGRMSLKRYLPAVTVGCLIWALIYSTVGMAVVLAWLELGWQWVVATAIVLGIVTWAWIKYRRRDG